MSPTNRREFLLTASPVVAGASLIGTSRAWAGANDRIRTAVIGTGGRSKSLCNEMLQNKNVEIVALADPDQTRLDARAADIEKATGKRPRVERDLRKILEDKQIDAVTVVTCNHWHALATIWACQAGKHVYVEKPVSHNVFEGRKLVEAARKYNCIVQGGTQRRSWGRFRKAMQLLRDGAIGDIYMSRTVLIQPRESIGFKEVQAAPAHLDWDLWLGPAQQQPYHANLTPYNWHWFWEFGNGEMGNNGSHFLDILRWGTGKGLPSRIYSVGGRVGYKDQAQTPNTESATFTYDDDSVMQIDIRNFYTAEPQYEWHFYGSKGYLFMDEDWKEQRFDYKIYMGRNKSAEPDQGTMETLNHYGNFLDAVRTGSREKLTCDVDEARKTSALCHLAAISHRLKREIRFDPKSEKAIGDEEASRLLTRQYRKPFVVPDKV